MEKFILGLIGVIAVIAVGVGIAIPVTGGGDGESPPPSDVVVVRDTGSLELNNADVADILRLTLERALVAREVPDYGLLVEGKDSIVLSTENIEVDLVTDIPGVDLVLLSPEEIQDKANSEGDFLHLNFFTRFKFADSKVEVNLANSWAVSEDSDVGYLSGGFFTLEYEKVDGQWQGTLVAIAIA